jgi:hypothetical protein
LQNLSSFIFSRAKETRNILYDRSDYAPAHSSIAEIVPDEPAKIHMSVQEHVSVSLLHTRNTYNISMLLSIAHYAGIVNR